MAISDELLNAERLVRGLFPNGRQERINGADCLRASDMAGGKPADNDGSFIIRLTDGRWYDFNGGVHGDTLDILKARYGYDNRIAVKVLREKGYLPDKPQRQRPDYTAGQADYERWEAALQANRAMPGPKAQADDADDPFGGPADLRRTTVKDDDAALAQSLIPFPLAPATDYPTEEFIRDYAAFKGWTLDADTPYRLFPYRAADDRLAIVVVRFNLADGKKQVRPLRWQAEGQWRWKQSGYGPAPLYNLPALLAEPQAPALIVEGEKAAQAGIGHKQLAGLIPTCPLGGSSVRPTDWTPLANRKVYILGDNDDAGSKFVGKVYALAQQAGAQPIVRIAPATAYQRLGGQGEPPPGWDIADAVILAQPCADCGKVAVQPRHSPEYPYRCADCVRKIMTDFMTPDPCGATDLPVDAAGYCADCKAAGWTFPCPPLTVAA